MSFPVLSAEELVAAFQGRIPEMQISEADLKKPTDVVVQYWYSCIVKELFDLTTASLCQMADTSSLEYPTLYSLEFISLSLFVSRLMTQCQIKDFAFVDLIEPKPKKTITHLSGVFNFALFLDDRQDVYDSISDHQAKLAEDRQHMQQRISHKKAKILELRRRISEKQENLEQLKLENEHTKGIANEMTQEVRTIDQKLDNLKREKAEISTKHCHNTEKAMMLREELDKAVEGIIQSPDKLESEMERLKESQRQTEERYAYKLKGVKLLKSDENAKEEIFEQLQQYKELCNVVLEEITKAETLTKEDQDFILKISDTCTILDEFRVEVENRKSKSARINDVDVKGNLKHQLKCKNLEEQLQQLTSELSQCTIQDNKGDALVTEHQTLSNALAQCKESHYHTMKQMEEKYHKLLSNVESYNTRLFDILKQANGFDEV